MRLVWRFLPLTGLNRFGGASYGTQHRVNRHMEEAMVAYRKEESPRLAHEMPPKEMTLTLDETFTDGLCVVGMAPESHYIVLEHTAPTRDQDTWHAWIAPALAGLNGQVIPATSEEAPGLLAYVAHHLGAPHSPDLFPVQPELSKAVAVPMAAKQRAAAKAMITVEERLPQAQEPAQRGHATPQRRGPGRPPKAPSCLEQVQQEGATARQEHQRLAEQREQVTQSIRALGHAYHFVDLERGVRRNGKLIAGDSHTPIDTIRTIAHQEHLNETCLERNRDSCACGAHNASDY
jgi:hypothetical protein